MLVINAIVKIVVNRKGVGLLSPQPAKPEAWEKGGGLRLHESNEEYSCTNTTDS